MFETVSGPSMHHGKSENYRS